MKFTTHLELHSQTTRLVEGPSMGRRRPAWHGILTLCDVLFQGTWGRRSTPKMPLQITTRRSATPDFKFELLPLHSPLLGQSLLVSFPPLIDMLKFSGYPYLIRGVRRGHCLPARRRGPGGWQPRRAGAPIASYHARPRGRRPPMHSGSVAPRLGAATAAITTPTPA